MLCPTEDVVPESVYDTKWVNKGFPWMDRQYKERKLQVLHTQLEQYKDVAGNYLPPLVFCSPQETKETAMENYTVLKGEYGQDYIEKQRKIWNEYFVQRKQLLAQYIPMI